MPQTPWPATLRWCGSPTQCAIAAVLAALGPASTQYRLVARSHRLSELTYLDTADRRLDRNGLTLSHHRNGGAGRLVLSDARGQQASMSLAAAPVWPARAEQLPDGPVRDALGPAIWIRAVAPVASARSDSRAVSVLDQQGTTVARLEWLEVSVSGPEPVPPVSGVRVRPVDGHGGDAQAVISSLLDNGGFEPAGGSLDREVLDGVRTPSPRPDPITPGQRADLAVAGALLGFAAEITANLDGTIEDVDTEFLHELRVAVRRSRSLVKQARKVLPADLADRYAPELKWLGDLTTPTRDLDVYLLELDELGQRLQAGQPADLEPFGEHLRRQRRAARRALVRGLRSRRFSQLISGWQAELESVLRPTGQEPGGGVGDTPEQTAAAGGGRVPAAADLAAERIARLDRKVRRLARVITPESPSESVHALRKRCKELRYVLEVFRPLCDPDAFRRVLKELKQVQDVLGAFQDGEVQSAALRVFAQQMLDGGPVPATALLALGELSGFFAEQQRAARVELTARLQRFASTRRITGLLDRAA